MLKVYIAIITAFLYEGKSNRSVKGEEVINKRKYSSRDIPAVLRLFLIIDTGISLYIGHNGPGNPRFRIRTMATFLSGGSS